MTKVYMVSEAIRHNYGRKIYERQLNPQIADLLIAGS